MGLFIITALIVPSSSFCIAEPSLIFIKEVSYVGIPSPGAILTYTLCYTNAGSGTATDVVLTDEIPTGTIYIYDSASETDIIYSHDGGLTYNTSQAEPITHIRWNLNETIAPEGSGNVSFKVRVE